MSGLCRPREVPTRRPSTSSASCSAAPTLGRLRRVRPLLALVVAVLLVAAGVWTVWFSPLLAAHRVA